MFFFKEVCFKAFLTFSTNAYTASSAVSQHMVWRCLRSGGGGWSRRPCQEVSDIKIIFITTLRCYLPFLPCSHKSERSRFPEATWYEIWQWTEHRRYWESSCFLLSQTLKKCTKHVKQGHFSHIFWFGKYS